MQKNTVVSIFLGAAFVMPFAAHSEGLYVSVGLGKALYDEVAVLSIPLEDAEPGSGSIAVGYRLDQTWDAEVGYIHFGNVGYSYNDSTRTFSHKIKTQTIYVAAVGKVPFTPSFSAQGKLGLAVNRSEDKMSLVTTSGSLDEGGIVTKATVLAGLGLAYQFTPSLAGLLDYTYLGKVSDSGMKVSMVNLGLRYHF